MHFEVDAIAQVTSVPVARGEQLVCLFSAVSASTHHSRVTSMTAWNIFSSGAGFCFSAAVPRGGLGGAEMKSPVVKRSIRIAGHKTSITEILQMNLQPASIFAFSRPSCKTDARYPA